MGKVDVTAPGKLFALLAVVLGAFAVIVVAILTDAEAAIITSMVGLLGTTLGYLVGNGTGAARGFVSVPPFQPAPSRQLEILTRIVEEDLELKQRAERLIQRTKQDDE